MGKRLLLRSGPPRGVVNTTSPFDDDPKYLQDAVNGYIPNADQLAGWFARPGFTRKAGPLGNITDGVYAHTDSNGTVYNFAVIGTQLFRVSADFTTFTDVTPAAHTFPVGVGHHIRFVSLTGQLVISDGNRRPWVASNLGATPITATDIDFDGLGTAWSARDVTVYSGAVLFLLKVLGPDILECDIAWSAPGDASLGYQQPNYDYRWTLQQTGSAPIFAVFGTNIGLYYFRQQSIGLAVGALGPSFQTTHTDDAVAANVGCLAPQTICEFSNRLFFVDQYGRPQMLPLGGTLDPIWQNMRSDVDASQRTGFISAVATASTAVIVTTLNLYCVAIWPSTDDASFCQQWYAFDAATGTYYGRMYITGSDGVSPTFISAFGTLVNDVGRSVFVVFGSGDSTYQGTDYLWSFNIGTGSPVVIASENGTWITSESGVVITSEGDTNVWKDNGVVPAIAVTTNLMGYSAEAVLNVDQVTVITGSNAPVRLTVRTPNMLNAVEGTPSPSVSQDGTYRLVAGVDAFGRGVQWTISPTTADDQWSFQQVSMVAVPSLASPEDP